MKYAGILVSICSGGGWNLLTQGHQLKSRSDRTLDGSVYVILSMHVIGIVETKEGRAGGRKERKEGRKKGRKEGGREGREKGGKKKDNE